MSKIDSINIYKEAFNGLINLSGRTPVGRKYMKVHGDVLDNLIDYHRSINDHLVITKSTFIGLCKGDLSSLDITGMTLYELTGDEEDYDGALD